MTRLNWLAFASGGLIGEALSTFFEFNHGFGLVVAGVGLMGFVFKSISDHQP